MWWGFPAFGLQNVRKKLIGVGFEPTPPKRPVPETGALDRSAIQPHKERRTDPALRQTKNSGETVDGQFTTLPLG